MTTKILHFISFDKTNQFINGYFSIASIALNNDIIISVYREIGNGCRRSDRIYFHLNSPRHYGPILLITDSRYTDIKPLPNMIMTSKNQVDFFIYYIKNHLFWQKP
jgi:hypothetical protein